MQKAIRLKKGAADEVVVVSVGARQAAETLRTALAKLLKAAMDAEQPRLVIAGNHAVLPGDRASPNQGRVPTLA